MKKLYLLGGNDAANLQWINQISQKIGMGFDSVDIQEYEHWTTGIPIIDKSSNKGGELLTIEGSDHSYNTFDAYIPKVLEFISI
jgi:hypothetical protein